MRVTRLLSSQALPVLLLLAAVGLSGCGLGRALGANKNSPDEFNIVTKAPLVIPPDYALKPPTPTEKSDQADTTADAQAALIGRTQPGAHVMSQGEQLLLAQAGAEYADPMIRAVVDQEYAGLVDKSPDMADRLIFWDHPRPMVNAQVNPGAEAIRMEQKQSGAKNEKRADTSTQEAQPASAGAVTDQVEGQPKPTIGKTHSRLLDGVF